MIAMSKKQILWHDKAKRRGKRKIAKLVRELSSTQCRETDRATNFVCLSNHVSTDRYTSDLKIRELRDV